MSNEIKKETYISYTTKNTSHHWPQHTFFYLNISSLLHIFLYLYQVIHIDYENRYHMHTKKKRTLEKIQAIHLHYIM